MTDFDMLQGDLEAARAVWASRRITRASRSKAASGARIRLASAPSAGTEHQVVDLSMVEPVTSRSQQNELEEPNSLSGGNSPKSARSISTMSATSMAGMSIPLPSDKGKVEIRRPRKKTGEVIQMD